MSYTLTYALNLGSTHSGLSDLRAQLRDSTGTTSGSAISTGFTEIGSGVYQWTNAFASPFTGSVAFYSNAAPSTILVGCGIDPTDFNASISGSGAYAITVHVTDGTNPLTGASVRMTAGSATYTATTDGSGNAALSLDAGSYTLSITKTGYQYTPSAQTVTTTATITAAMSVASTTVVTGSPSTTLATVYLPGSRAKALILANSAVVLLARITTAGGAYAQQSDISSISVKVYDRSTGLQIGTTLTPSVASSVYNALQVDGRWNGDSTGYNLAISLPGSYVPTGQTTYQVQTTVTPLVDNPFLVVWDVQATQVY